MELKSGVRKAMIYNDETFQTYVQLDQNNTDEYFEIGLMTQSQKKFIMDENKKCRIANEIIVTNELSIMLHDLVINNLMQEYTAEDFADLTDDDAEKQEYLNLTNVMFEAAHENTNGQGCGAAKIPADLIISGNIPVKNLRLVHDDSVENTTGLDTTITYSVVMYDRFDHDAILEMVNSDTDTGYIVVGFMKREIFDKKGHRMESVGCPIITDLSDKEPVLVCDVRHVYFTDNNFKVFQKLNKSEVVDLSMKIKMMFIEMSTSLAQWYAIQQLLLNPLVEKYQSSTSVIDNLKKGGGKNGGKKPPVRYIKRIKLDTDDTINLIYKKDEKGNRVRKTLIWYVCGHWVNRKGKKYFRHGYWKGPLRDSNPEMFIDGVRQREVV